MPRFTARERRERYLREYKFQQKHGKKFFPDAVYHDTIVSLIVVAGLILISWVWYHGFAPVPHDPTAGRDGGVLGPAYEAKADPGSLAYDPRPDWYYFWLFQLLRIFSTPQLVMLGTIIVPTILMILLFAWPFLDRSPERRISRRPFGMALGAAVPVVLLALTWAGSQAPAVGGAASNHPGSAAFAAAGCGTCHSLADAGTTGNVGPNLDSLHADYATVLHQIQNGGGPMPKYQGQLTDDQISCLAGYVATYAGGNGKKGPSASSAAATYPAACIKAAGAYVGGGAAAVTG